MDEGDRAIESLVGHVMDGLSIVLGPSAALGDRARAPFEACLGALAVRRSTAIETGLFQIQGELMQDKTTSLSGRRRGPLPEWYVDFGRTKPKNWVKSIASVPVSRAGPWCYRTGER